MSVPLLCGHEAMTRAAARISRFVICSVFACRQVQSLPNEAFPKPRRESNRGLTARIEQAVTLCMTNTLITSVFH